MGSGSKFGETGEVLSPVKISDANVIAYDGSYSSTMFVRDDGSLWAVGTNSFGHFGDGTTASKSDPVQILFQVCSM